MSKTYQVSRVIGRGGFGIVEEVHDLLGNRYARKTFRPNSSISIIYHDKLKKRFKREALTQAQLGGTDLMPILDMDLEAPNPWFVMPLAEKTYETQIAEDRQSGSVNVHALADILGGLEFLHDLGYTHRDLNPKNILLHDRKWKLSDLGAILPPSGQTVTLTEGTIIYTEQYCSPEQRNDFHSAKPPADIYSLGCILHDIYGNPPRTPFGPQTAPENNTFSVIIEKCTETNPARRPTVSVLREILFEALVETGGQCTIDDPQSDAWLHKIETINDWTDTDYEQFARFFGQIKVHERTEGFEHSYTRESSTPFMTRIPSSALARITRRQDGFLSAIVEKYCEWADSNDFVFSFSDFIGTRLAAIFDNGSPADKAMAFISMVKLGESHNRWYVMREMLGRCGPDVPKEVTKRLAIELRVADQVREFRRCVEEVSWPIASLAPELAKLCEPEASK